MILLKSVMLNKYVKSFSFYLGLIILSSVLSGCQVLPGIESKLGFDSSWRKVKKKGKLTIGTRPENKPMEYFNQDGEMIGFDLDLANEISLKLKLELEVVAYDQEAMFEALDSGEIDLAISSIIVTLDKLDKWLFSASYLTGGQAIMAKKDDETINKVEDLRWKIVGVQEGTPGVAAALELEYVDKVLLTVIPDSGLQDKIGYLQKGEIDALIIDNIEGVEYVKDNPDLKIISPPFTKEQYGIAAKQKNKSLINKVNKALKEIEKNGRLEAIKNKWL